MQLTYFIVVLHYFVTFTLSISTDDVEERILEDELLTHLRERILRDRLENELKDFVETSNNDSEEDVEDVTTCETKSMFRYTSTDVDKLLTNLEKMMKFFEKHSHQIIVDGLFGMRATEGVFVYVLDRVPHTHPLYKRVKQLHDTLHNICEKIYKMHKKSSDEYTQSFLKLTYKAFNFQRPWKKFNKDYLWKITQKKAIDEQESDRCVKGIIGAYKDHGDCYIDQKCWTEETRAGTKGYYLTHQILFLLAGEAKKCHTAILDKVGSEDDLNEWYDRSGSNIYAQMISNLHIMKDGDEDLRDITAEQGMVCQSLGIVECFRMDMLRKTLSWVNDEGCCRDNPNEIKDQLHDVTNRFKRVDVPIGACSQHLTAVLMGYYANHLPFILLPPPCNLLQ